MAVAHKDLTGLNLHEPKGVADASVGRVYQSDGEGSGTWLLNDFQSGTKMPFRQSAAPTGWTKLTGDNNKALRIVSGDIVDGGSTPFTGVFTGRTITHANLPNVNLTAASINLRLRDGTTGDGGSNDLAGRVAYGQTGVDTFEQTLNDFLAGTLTVPLGGSGTAMDFNVQFVDIIFAEKD